jgi:hypothetical protein
VDNLLAISIQASVPLHIMEMQAKGGPSEQDLRDARVFSGTLGEKGDVLLFGGKKGEAAGLFNQLARSVAVLSFCPGGVILFGQHFTGRVKPRKRKLPSLKT